MIDIGVVRVRDLLTPDEILVQESSILLRVQRVRDVDRVLIDSLPVPFTISLGMVKVLTEDITTPMETVEVILAHYTGGGKTKAEFLITAENMLISGRQVLLQDIVRLLFAKPRSNTFRPAEGGGALQSISQVYPNARLSKVRAVTAVATVEDQIRRQQVTARGLTASERLVSLSVADVTIDDNGTGVGIIVTTQKGRSFLGVRA